MLNHVDGGYVGEHSDVELVVTSSQWQLSERARENHPSMCQIERLRVTHVNGSICLGRA
jgi:hypothetical protein